MVNDHSNEMDVELAKSFQKMDHRFHLIHSTGNGIIDALKTGLEKANGKYISRMDADDIMTNDKIAKKNAQDIAMMNEKIIKV